MNLFFSFSPADKVPANVAPQGPMVLILSSFRGFIYPEQEKSFGVHKKPLQVIVFGKQKSVCNECVFTILPRKNTCASRRASTYNNLSLFLEDTGFIY
jgi:hypothetical protein